jgi:acylpyruvate hydrolase
VRLVRFKKVGGPVRLGALVDSEQKILDLQAACAELLRSNGDPFAEEEAAIRIPSDTALFLGGGTRGDELARAALAAYLRGDRLQVPIHRRDEVRLEAPIVPPLIICGGANFADHLREIGRDKPDHVEFFLKNSTTVLGPEDDIPYQPWASLKLDYEVELGIVIGRRARRVKAADALDYVYGYTVVNDMAVRDRQLFRFDGTSFHVKYGDGKVFDANSVIGPSIVTKDEIADPMTLDISCLVSGVVRQAANTSGYIWGVHAVIEYYSSIMTLEPGYVICPGTAGGCAIGSDPECGGMHTPRDPKGEYLRPGQSVRVAVAGIGAIENTVRLADLAEFRSAPAIGRH